MKNLFIDIETVGIETPKPEDVKTGNIKDPAKIKAKQNDSKELEKLKRSYSVVSSKAKIICMAFAIDDNPVIVISHPKEDELIKLLEQALKGEGVLRWVGHNISAFDIPFVYHRAVKYGSKLRKLIPTNSRGERVFDTMVNWSPTKWGEMISMDNIAKYLNIKSSKQGIDGSKVYDYYHAGKIDEICEYCAADVEVVRKIYNKMT